MTTYVGDVETYQTPDRGRGVTCTADTKKGTTLLKEECIACVLCSNVRGSYCDHCLLPGYDQLMRCSGCKFARYCNRKCQKNAWIDHKEECKGLKRVAPNIPTDTVRLLARIMHKNRKTPKPVSSVDDKNFPLAIDQLQGDVEKMVEQRREDMGAIFFVLEKFLGGDLLGYTAADILRLFVVVEINGFHLFDHELKNIGYALYQRASMVNHHCEPNCLVVFEGSVLEVRTLQDLKKGDEVLAECKKSRLSEEVKTISRLSIQSWYPGLLMRERFQLLITYIETLATTEKRRDMLMEQFRFHCMCRKCEDPYSDQVLRCILCPECNCNGHLRNVSDGIARCTLCGLERSTTDALWEKFTAAEEKAETLLESANKHRSQEKWRDMLLCAEQCLDLPYLHPSHFAMLRARNVTMDAHIELQNWEEALRYGEDNLEAYRHQYQFNHPSVGVQLMRVGKLYNYLGKVPDALQIFKQAMDIISVTHATQHPLHQALSELLMACQMELRGNMMPSVTGSDIT